MSQATFVVNIMYTQNNTWQGTIDWLHGKEKTSLPFRSALELIRIMDSTIQKEESDEEEF